MQTSAILAIIAAAYATIAAPTVRSAGPSVADLLRADGSALRITIEPLDAGGDQVFQFSSTQAVKATPDQVVNGTTPTGGLPGASGTYNFGINSQTDTICYNITLYGFRGEYQSPAATATHIHEAARGASGPPRIAFPNPQPVAGNQEVRNSVGCLTGPFKTGVLANGVDTGAGFKVASIEKNPSGFFADVHSSLAVPGAVRGQLA
ncbi:hypothetical protein KVR01_011748 [Diaporthe batatas]|uniref:uncharacterized protein n=1 Tax=Diaporthe batatas TaxID=748121 RepID=UPI001D0582B8|nr:uncharacterized protein KVR01_011748 [Diaporthe batatas]KAG8158626.1 hypothetical protein KVR01_011748 [Diaporthe batatas]